MPSFGEIIAKRRNSPNYSKKRKIRRGSRKSRSLSRVSFSCGREAFRGEIASEDDISYVKSCAALRTFPRAIPSTIVKNGQEKDLVVVTKCRHYSSVSFFSEQPPQKVEKSFTTFSSIFLNITVVPCVRYRVSPPKARKDIPRIKSNTEDEV